MTRSIHFLFALTLIAAVGCQPVAEEDVDEAWETTSYALMDAEPNSATAAEFETFGNGDILDGCPDGGQIDSQAQVDLSLLEISGDGVSAGVRYESAFAGCKVDDTTIDGNLTWTMSADVSDDVSVSWTWAGSLTYSGEISGTCDVDMSGEVLVDSDGVEVQYAGTYCGYDAAAHLKVSSDSVMAQASGEGGSFMAGVF